MDAFLGKWKSHREGNKGDVVAYLKAAEMPQEKIDYYVKIDNENDSYATIKQDGDSYIYSYEFGPINADLTFKLGEAVEKEMPPENKLTKMIYNLEDGALVDVTEQGKIKTTHKRTVSGDTMTVVITSGANSLTRQYKKVE